MRRTAGLLFFLIVLLTACSFAQSIHSRVGITLSPPPVADANPVIDNYFGTKITDNYRWLEDPKSPETRTFIDEENVYTTRYLKQDSIHNQALDDLDPLEHTSRWTIPIQRAGNYYFMKRLAGEEQASIYVRHGWTGAASKGQTSAPGALSRPRTSVSSIPPPSAATPTPLSASPTSRAMECSSLTRSAREARTRLPFASSASQKRSRSKTNFPRASITRSISLPTAKASTTRAPTAKARCSTFTSSAPAMPTTSSSSAASFTANCSAPSILFRAQITDDARFLVLTIERGVPAKRVDICFRDLTKPGSPFEVLVWGLDSRFATVYAKGAWYVRTDYSSPNGRVLRADPGIMPEAWKTIVPEGKDVLETFSIVGDKIYVKRLHDVQSEISVYTLDGKPAGKVDLEGIGSASGVVGRTTDRYGFFSFESWIQPPTIYRVDTLNGKMEIFAQPKVPFDTAQYELKQVFYKSNDGTQIPMFIAGKKGLPQDGSARLLMTGYGGFNLSETPAWNPAWAWWLQQGGWFAVPNMRGGGEYGESWHEQGMFEKKQNVFDDWFGAAHYLIDNKYTSPEHFAITGRSNGGLLMGASFTQHPELFSAVWCGYPLLDMLRYHKFEQGPHWTTEYGSAENEKQFPYLLKYSPYQNVKPRSDYPAIMFFTGDSDTRVDPLHARKMTALMQSESKSGRPILLHYSLAGGHSAGVSVEQQIQDDADQLSFLWTETGSPAKPKPNQGTAK